MHFALNILALIFSVNMATSLTAAEEPHLPPHSWEQHAGGIALAMTLTSQLENNQKKNEVHIYIKNTSDAILDFLDSGIDWNIRIYYINANGIQIPLHEYENDSKSVEGLRLPISLKPGQVVLRNIYLTPDEYILLKSHPVKCSFLIYDPRAGKSHKVESTPKMLVSGS